MKQNIMKKWVKALRSGKFKQGTGTLKQYNRKGKAEHCCLGVLCELYNGEMRKNKKKTLPEKVYDNDSDFSYGYSRFGNSKCDLPKEVMNWSGMKDKIGRFTTDNSIPSQYTLADLNDLGKKFKGIADIIEKNWENL